jgi:hypothetical protein
MVLNRSIANPILFLKSMNNYSKMKQATLSVTVSWNQWVLLSMPIQHLLFQVKDGRIRWVSDFRKLNAMLRRSIYPLP